MAQKLEKELVEEEKEQAGEGGGKDGEKRGRKQEPSAEDEDEEESSEEGSRSEEEDSDENDEDKESGSKEEEVDDKDGKEPDDNSSGETLKERAGEMHHGQELPFPPSPPPPQRRPQTGEMLVRAAQEIMDASESDWPMLVDHGHEERHEGLPPPPQLIRSKRHANGHRLEGGKQHQVIYIFTLPGLPGFFTVFLDSTSRVSSRSNTTIRTTGTSKRTRWRRSRKRRTSLKETPCKTRKLSSPEMGT